MLNIHELEKRVLDISFKYKLSHISSCLTALPILVEIFNNKTKNDRFVLSNGHSGLSLYCVLEKVYGIDAEKLFNKHGVHPNRDPENYIDCSSGSLGCGICLAVGMALAGQNTYCLISDGETFEGSVWEGLALKTKLKLNNLHIYVNINGYSAYDTVNVKELSNRLLTFCPDINLRYTNTDKFPFLNGIDGHYYILKDGDIHA